MPPLTQIAAELLKQARRTGADRAADLAHGARIAFRVEQFEEIETITLSIARRGKPVGASEEVTFKRYCAVPPGATRHPDAPEQQRLLRDGQEWHRIVYRWVEELPL
jgi:hypothetical protein